MHEETLTLLRGLFNKVRRKVGGNLPLDPLINSRIYPKATLDLPSYLGV
jgi:hypothetical protein